MVFALGYMTHKSIQADRMNHMRNVGILQKYDDYNYRIQSRDNGAIYRVNFCTDIAPPFEEGMVLTDLVYEKTSKCLRLSTGWFRNEIDESTGKWVDFREQGGITNASIASRHPR